MNTAEIEQTGQTPFERARILYENAVALEHTPYSQENFPDTNVRIIYLQDGAYIEADYTADTGEKYHFRVYNRERTGESAFFTGASFSREGLAQFSGPMETSARVNGHPVINGLEGVLDHIASINLFGSSLDEQGRSVIGETMMGWVEKMVDQQLLLPPPPISIGITFLPPTK